MLLPLGIVVALIAAPAEAARTRVFFSAAQGDEALSEAHQQIDGAILVAARAHDDRFDVKGAQDIQGVLRTEATRAALGCDTMQCASEIADALDADQLVMTQVGRVGSTWVLTLTRVERATLQVISRTQVQADGDTPAVLLDRLPTAVDKVLGVWTSPLVPLGVGMISGGALAAALGTGATLAAFNIHAEGKQLVDSNPAAAAAARERGEPLYWTGWSLIGAAAAVTLAGAAALTVGMLDSE